MNIRKGSKGQLTPAPTPQNGPYLPKTCACISCYPGIVSPRIYATITVIKKLQYNFPKMRGEGSKADRNFSENSSDLVTRPLDQRDQCETCLNGHDASLMNCKIKSSVVFLKSTFKTHYFPF